MKIAFRCDWGPGIGLGHVGRNVSLAEAAMRQGHEPIFICCGFSDPDAYRPALGSTVRLNVTPMVPWTLADNPDQNDLAHQHYGVVDADASILAMREHRVEAVVLDHYFLSDLWAKQVRDGGIPVFVIDDIDRKWESVSALIDPRPGADLQGRAPTGIPVFAGVHYFPISRSIVDARRNKISGEASHRRITIFTGGADTTGLSRLFFRVLDALTPAPEDVLLIVGSNASDREETIAVAMQRSWITVTGEIEDVGRVYEESQLVLGAGGVSMLERCCVGVAQIVVSVSENQIPQCEALSNVGAVNYIGSVEQLDEAGILESIQRLTHSKELAKEMEVKARNTIDEHGAGRLFLLLADSQSVPVFRAVHPSDVHLLFMWANDPVAREHARNQQLIEWTEHRRWFSGVVTGVSTHVLILEWEGVPVGMLRLDLDATDGVISYSVDRDFRGRGLGRMLLVEAVKLARRLGLESVSGQVKHSNHASLRLFRDLGFREMAEQGGDFVGFTKGL